MGPKSWPEWHTACVLVLAFTLRLTGGWIVSLSPDTKCGKCSTKQVGDDMTFTCSVNMETGDAGKFADITMRWLNQSMNKIEMALGKYRPRVSSAMSSGNTINLKITDIKETDAGSYTCEVYVNASREIIRRPTSLVVIKIPKIQFVETPETQYPRVNSNALIRCQVEAQPQPVVTWYFKDHPLVNGGRYTIAENGLIIHRLTKEDEGVYICNAEIPIDRRMINKTIRVIPASTPMINKPLNDVIGASGRVTVKCMASGKPVPNYHWFKSGSASPLLDPKYHVDNKTGVLVINNLTRADEGKYICIASNPAGDTIATVDVKNVTVMPTTTVIGQTEIEQGDNLTLTCTVAGQPFPKVHWQKNEEKLRWSNESKMLDERISIRWCNDSSLQLAIINVTNSDRGRYKCLAINMGGTSNSSININVSGLAETTKDSPSSIDKLNNGSELPQEGSRLLHVAWGVSLGVIVVIVLVVIASLFWRRRRGGGHLSMSPDMIICSSCIVCIHENKMTKKADGGSLRNASSKEKIAFSELLDTPEISRKESLSVISNHLSKGRDNEISSDKDETGSSPLAEYDNNLNEEKNTSHKAGMKDGGYTELTRV